MIKKSQSRSDGRFSDRPKAKLNPKPKISDSYRRLSPAGESIIVVWNSRHRFGSFLAFLKRVDVFFQSGNKVKHYFVQYISFEVIKERHIMTHGMSSSNLKIKYILSRKRKKNLQEKSCSIFPKRET
jgi:hypothetical protein